MKRTIWPRMETNHSAEQISAWVAPREAMALEANSGLWAGDTPKTNSPSGGGEGAGAVSPRAKARPHRSEGENVGAGGLIK